MEFVVWKRQNCTVFQRFMLASACEAMANINLKRRCAHSPLLTTRFH